MKRKVMFSENNSGGYYRLKREDYEKLQADGWVIEFPLDDRSICSLRTATKAFTTIKGAMRRWKQITGRDYNDQGCPCCGPPYNFWWDD